MDGLLHEIVEGRMRGKPTRERRIQMLHDWQRMMSVLHSSEQKRTEKDGESEEGYKSAVSQKATAHDSTDIMQSQ